MTCDELDNLQQKKIVIRRRKLVYYHLNYKFEHFFILEEVNLLDKNFHLKFLMQSKPVGLDENQLKTIPYEKVKTSSQSIRISLSLYSSPQRRRRRCSSSFNRSSS
ncbi:unnamed protein product [Rotaria sp. Silwood2]|nr:unnamed protein product [Rotaria sp. Silwood2]